MASKIALTGIQPSGDLHLGNYLGAIRPALELVANYDAYYFIADGHALTTVLNADELRRQTYEAAATWIALGLDPTRVVIYRQSDIPEVFELSWVLSCVTPKGLLNRAHKYKDVVDENAAAGRTPDDGVSMGLFNYPVLMAADILIVGANVVPVGADNKQHLEIARDISEAFNRTFGETFPAGPIWVLHLAYVMASALMLAWWLRYRETDTDGRGTRAAGHQERSTAGIPLNEAGAKP